MRVRIAFIGLLLALGVSAGAQDYRSFSLEAGTGLQPLHMTFAPTKQEQRMLAQSGQMAHEGDSMCPTLSLSEVWRLSGHWELCLTEGLSWKIYDLVQYPAFGTDPNGKTRYDANGVYTSLGKKASWPTGTLYAQARVIWSPKWKLTCYSAAGLGLVVASFSPGDISVLPGITPVGLRFGGEHLYGFAEFTISPIATLVHGGIGWRF